MNCTRDRSYCWCPCLMIAGMRIDPGGSPIQCQGRVNCDNSTLGITHAQNAMSPGSMPIPTAKGHTKPAQKNQQGTENLDTLEYTFFLVSHCRKTPICEKNKLRRTKRQNVKILKFAYRHCRLIVRTFSMVKKCSKCLSRNASTRKHNERPSIAAEENYAARKSANNKCSFFNLPVWVAIFISMYNQHCGWGRRKVLKLQKVRIIKRQRR